MGQTHTKKVFLWEVDHIAWKKGTKEALPVPENQRGCSVSVATQGLGGVIFTKYGHVEERVGRPTSKSKQTNPNWVLVSNGAGEEAIEECQSRYRQGGPPIRK